MTAGESQNLPGLLEQTEALYRDPAAQLPVTGAMIARQARHFATTVRLSRDEPRAIRRLNEATGGLGDLSSLSSLLPRVLDGALSLMGADFGTVQLLDPATGSLRLVTHCGFDSGFLEYFAVVDDDHSACGRAARGRAQVVIPDVNADPGFAPHCGIAAASGFRAVQSTPLADESGHQVGVVSTHFRRPLHPADLDLRIMVLYADVAGQAIAAQLMALGADIAGQGSPEQDPAPVAASPGDTVAHFAEYIVNRLFSVGLSLDSALSIAGEGPAGDRVTAAIDNVDRLIREIRDYLFTGRIQGPQPGPPGEARLAARERPTQTTDRAALLQERMARTARALQASAADYAALLEQKADLVRQPGRMDYPAEIKRWHAFADQAEQMVTLWEQSPLPTCPAAVPARVVLRRKVRGPKALDASHRAGQRGLVRGQSPRWGK